MRSDIGEGQLVIFDYMVSLHRFHRVESRVNDLQVQVSNHLSEFHVKSQVMKMDDSSAISISGQSTPGCNLSNTVGVLTSCSPPPGTLKRRSCIVE